MSAPLDSRSVTISAWPSFAAKCKGVLENSPRRGKIIIIFIQSNFQLSVKKTSRHSVNQSEAKLKPIMTCSLTFSRALGTRCTEVWSTLNRVELTETTQPKLKKVKINGTIQRIFTENSMLETCDIAWFTSPRLLELMACVRGAATTPILVSTTPSGTVPFSPPAITCDTCLLADGRDNINEQNKNKDLGGKNYKGKL
ncbi:hypothetical protein pdam_00002037, partial [Pocillopora damicornis]